MAGLENQRPADVPALEPIHEPLSFRHRNLAGVGDERDDRLRPSGGHDSPTPAEVDAGRLPRRGRFDRGVEAVPCPVIVATRRRSIARSAASSRPVVSAVSNPRRRAATASSWWNGMRKRRKPSTVWLSDSPSDAATRPYSPALTAASLSWGLADSGSGASRGWRSPAARS